MSQQVALTNRCQDLEVALNLAFHHTSSSKIEHMCSETSRKTGGTAQAPPVTADAPERKPGFQPRLEAIFFHSIRRLVAGGSLKCTSHPPATQQSGTGASLGGTNLSRSESFYIDLGVGQSARCAEHRHCPYAPSSSNSQRTAS